MALPSQGARRQPVIDSATVAFSVKAWILFELGRMRWPAPLRSRITVHRILVRHGPIDARAAPVWTGLAPSP